MANIRVARDFFEHHLSDDLKSKIDLSALAIQDGSFVDAELKNNSTDIVYKVPLLTGEDGYLYVLVEHQSEPDYWLPFRLWIYVSRILERYRKQHPHARKLPLVVPIVFYTGKLVYPYSTDLLSLFSENNALVVQGLLGPHRLIDISQFSDEEISGHSWSGLMEMLLKHAKQRDSITLLKQIMRLFIVPLWHEPGADNYITSMLNYLLDQGETENIKSFFSVVQTEMPGEGRVMSIAEKLKQWGREEGVQQGMQQGMQQGEAVIILRLLERRFGQVPLLYVNRIKKANEETLFRWGEKILSACTLSEVFVEEDVVTY